MTFLDPHSAFQLNGISYSKDDLIELAYSYVKEGEPFEMEIGSFLLDWLNYQSTIEVHTSGSTGTPKTILLHKYRMVNSAKATGDFFDLKSGTTALHCLPMNFIAGKMMLVRALVLGLKMDCVEPTTCPLQNIDKHYGFSAMVPLQLQNSLDDIDKIKTLIIGGAKPSRELKEKTQSKKCSIYETYGMTETITHVAVKKINNLNSTGNPLYKNTFSALPNVFFSMDTRGCLVISAPNISEEVVVTNDLARLFSPTEFEWLGRYDFIINSGGIKLIPEVIEEKLTALIENRFFVSGLPDNNLGEKLILIIEGAVDMDLLVQRISSFKSIKKYERPKEIYMLPKFFETKNGKIRRRETMSLVIPS